MKDTKVRVEAKSKGSDEATNEVKTSGESIKIDAQAVREDSDSKSKGDKGNSADKESSIEISTVADISREDSAATQRAQLILKQKEARRKKSIKKLIRWVIIIAVLAVGFHVLGAYLSYKFVQATQDSSQTQTGTVERRDISEAISTTGKVQSKDTRTITSALNGVTIAKVNFEVGDYVNEGDVIVEFSREDIHKSIAEAEEDLAEARAAEALTNEYKAVDHEFDTLSAGYSLQLTADSAATALENLNQARKNLDQACSDKSDYVAKYNNAKDNIGRLQQEYDEATAARDLFTSTHSQQPLDSAIFPESGDNSPVEIINFLGYEYTMDELNNHISDLNSKIAEYKNTISSYDSGITNYEKSIISAQNSVRNAELSYESALHNQTDRNNSATKSYNASNYNYDSYLITAGDNVTKAERALEKQQDMLDDYVVYAPISGLVTSVSAQEGNGYVNTSGGLMTIQAVDMFEISTQIDEYDINNVVEGQQVVIMTDATGDDKLEGVVSFVSPIATSAATASTGTSQTATSASGNTYEVQIDILSNDQRVKLGMSAKINIIMDQHKNALAVPYDAIEKEDNGSQYVMVVTDKKNQNAGSNNGNGSDIMVVDTEGTVTSVPSGTPSNNEEDAMEDKEKKQTFIQYLFTPKAERKKELKESSSSFNSAAKKVYIETGLEDEYYTEVISTDLAEGATVILQSDDDSNNNMFFMGGGPRNY